MCVPSVSPSRTVRRSAFAPFATNTAVSSPSRTRATAGIRTTLARRSASMSTWTGAPTGTPDRPAQGQAHRHGRRAGIDGRRAGNDRDRVERFRHRLTAQVRRGADDDARRVGDGHSGDQLESVRIDDAEHHVGGGRLDEVARIVEPTRDDAVEVGANGGPGRDRLRRAKRGFRLGQGRLGVGDGAIGVLDLAARGDAAFEQLAGARLGGPGAARVSPGRAPLPPAGAARRPPTSASRSAPERRRDARDRPRRAASPRSAPPRAPRRSARRPAPA